MCGRERWGRGRGGEEAPSAYFTCVFRPRFLAVGEVRGDRRGGVAGGGCGFGRRADAVSQFRSGLWAWGKE